MVHRLTALLLTALAAASCDGKPGAPAQPAGRSTAGLGYTLSAPEGFALLMDNGKTKNWTPGGRAVAPDEPRIVLTRSSKVYPEDPRVRRLAPEQMVQGLSNDLTQVAIARTVPVTIDGMPGFETTARAQSARGASPVEVYAVALFAADGTFYVVAYDGGDDARDNMALFRRAAQSLTVK